MKEDRLQVDVKFLWPIEAEKMIKKAEHTKRMEFTKSKVFGIGIIVLILLAIGVFMILQSWQSSIANKSNRLYSLSDADFSDFSGNVVVIGFFATWCGSCLEQIPHLSEVVSDFEDNKVVVISVASVTDSDLELAQFKEDHNMSWLVSRDTVGAFSKYGIWAIPTIIILDQTGDIYYEHVGLAEANLLSSKISELLGD